MRGGENPPGPTTQYKIYRFGSGSDEGWNACQVDADGHLDFYGDGSSAYMFKNTGIYYATGVVNQQLLNILSAAGIDTTGYGFVDCDKTKPLPGWDNMIVLNK